MIRITHSCRKAPHCKRIGRTEREIMEDIADVATKLTSHLKRKVDRDYTNHMIMINMHDHTSIIFRWTKYQLLISYDDNNITLAKTLADILIVEVSELVRITNEEDNNNNNDDDREDVQTKDQLTVDYNQLKFGERFITNNIEYYVIGWDKGEVYAMEYDNNYPTIYKF